MKKWKLMFAVCLMSFSVLIAQKTKKGTNKMDDAYSAPKIAQGVLNMSQGAHNGFTILLPDTNVKTVKNMWKDLMKNYSSKVKSVKKSDDDLAAAASIATISGTGTVDVYSQIEDSGDNVSMTVWFDMGEGTYLSSDEYPNSYDDAEQLLQSFGTSVRKEMTERELKQEEKNLKKVEGDLRDLAKKKESLLKDIEKFKKKIIEAEEDIARNEAAQEETKTRIEEQKETVSEVATKLQNIE